MIRPLEPLRKTRRAALALLAAAALAACEPVALGGGGASGPAIDPSQPVRVALLVPGGGGTDALLSANLENAARLGIARAGGGVDLAVYPTGGTAAGGQAAAQRAVADGAAAIIGPLYAEAANAAGVAARPAGINVLAFSNNTAIAGGNVFVLGPTFENTARRLMDYGTRQGRGTVVAVTADSAAGAAAASAIDEAARGTGARLAQTVRYEFSEAGIAAAAPRVAEAVQTRAADMVMLDGDSAGALPVLARALPRAGVTPGPVQYAGTARWDIPPATLALPGLEGGWFTLPDQGRAGAFESAYAASYGGAPHPLAFTAYDAATAVTTLVRTGARDALSGRSLTRAQGFAGGAGAFRLLPDGTNARALAVATARGGRAVVIEAAPQGFGAGS